MKIRLLASLLGRGWTALLALAVAPVLIKYLGAEAYGLIGLYMTVQGLFTILDMGFSATATRELSGSSTDPTSNRAARDLLRTLEVIYITVGITIAGAAAFTAPSRITDWLNIQVLDKDTVEQALVFLFLAVGVQWPFGIYAGALTGRERQVTLNFLIGVFATLRWVGGAAIVILGGSIRGYFAWQILIGIAQTSVAAGVAWAAMPKDTNRPRFSLNRLQNVSHFALGVTGISLIGVALSQTDRIVIGTLLPLDALGYYSFAATAAALPYLAAGPIQSVAYPMLSRLLSEEKLGETIEAYHKFSRLMAVLLIPTSLVGALFSETLVGFWTGSEELTRQTHLVAALLTVGSAINGVVYLPYSLQLAAGKTSFWLGVNIVSFLLHLPLLVYATSNFGILGAALVWCSLNLGYLFVAVPIVHRKFLCRQLSGWYLKDMGWPLGVSFVIGIMGVQLSNMIQHIGLRVAFNFGVWLLATLFSAAPFVIKLKPRITFSI